MMKRIALTMFLAVAFVSLNAQNINEDKLTNLENKQQTGYNVTTATLKSASRLFKSADDLTSVILVVPKGSQVEVLDSGNAYLKVVYEENEGYILSRHAEIDRIAVPAEEERKLKQDFPVVEEQDQVQSRSTVVREKSRFTYLEEKYGTSMAARLNAGKIWKGMNSEMIRDSWGKPDKINREINGNTVKEEWIYRTTWLFIENNTLQEWGPVRK
ncbi:MAG TPA: hypothetical protein PL123_10580 [Bacteroidales bacterium]|nr:hypothetical protein [Bacteroidales bacterium]